MAAVPTPLPSVLWMPAHPATGALSMDRYWRELERERRAQMGPAQPGITCPLGDPSARREVGLTRWRVVRAWHKYAGYPWLVRRASRRPGIKVAHVLDHSFAHLLAQVPGEIYKVATVHDLAPLRDARELTAQQRARFRRTVEHLHAADIILADSRHSADEAGELLHLAPGKIQVLPLGVDVARFARHPSPAPPPVWRQELAGTRVLLSVGANADRKNLVSLPAIFRAAKALLPRTPLALLRVGDPLPGDLLGELHRELGEHGVIELGRAPDRDLVAAYQHADALILPSHLEGFGFPVLEAMAAECPVVCTNVTSLPEVGGAAALYFGPNDPAGAAGHLARLFCDEPWRRQKIAAGRVHADLFSWSEHFQKLIQIYQAAGDVLPPTFAPVPATAGTPDFTGS